MPESRDSLARDPQRKQGYQKQRQRPDEYHWHYTPNALDPSGFVLLPWPSLFDDFRQRGLVLRRGWSL